MRKLSFLFAIVLILSFGLSGCAKPAETENPGTSEKN